MKRIPKTIDQTADEIEARIKAREEDAACLPPGASRRRSELDRAFSEDAMSTGVSRSNN
jgi:hypothetical protein